MDFKGAPVKFVSPIVTCAVAVIRGEAVVADGEAIRMVAENSFDSCGASENKSLAGKDIVGAAIVESDALRLFQSSIGEERVMAALSPFRFF